MQDVRVRRLFHVHGHGRLSEPPSLAHGSAVHSARTVTPTTVQQGGTPRLEGLARADKITGWRSRAVGAASRGRPSSIMTRWAFPLARSGSRNAELRVSLLRRVASATLLRSAKSGPRSNQFG